MLEPGLGLISMLMERGSAGDALFPILYRDFLVKRSALSGK